MRKRVFGRKLSRTTNQRKALFKSLTNALTLHGRIETTEAKAKAIRGEVEKLITYAKTHADSVRYLQKHVHVHTAERIIGIAPLFKDRPGGYLRIIKMGTRKKDNAPMVILEFVEKVEAVKTSKKREKKPSSAKATGGQGKKIAAPKAKTEAKKKITKE